MGESAAITQFEAIDVHAHYGDYRQNSHELVQEFMTGDVETVLERARLARTRVTIVSPMLGLTPRGKADAVAGNEEAERAVAAVEGLLHWALVNPLQPETYAQAERLLAGPRCAGGKIHPEEHCYPIAERGREIFEFAAQHRAVILSHTGETNSMPGDFVPFVNEFPEVTLILAHLGHGPDGDPSHQVRAVQKSRHGNVFVDTSSARNIMPGLIEWAVQEIGAERILYGTDSPVYFAPMQRARIDYAQIADEAKRLILCGNAERLFEGRGLL